MFITDNLKNIATIAMYQAPAVNQVTPFHIQDFTEVIEILTGGKVLWNEDGKITTYERGTMFWHLPGEHTVFQTTPEAPYNCITFHFKTHRQPERIVPRITAWDNEEELQQFIKNAMRYFHDDSTNLDIFFPYIYAQLYWQAYYYQIRKPAPSYPPFLQKLLYFIYRHLRENLSVERLAELSGMSVPYIHAQFKKNLGVGPHQYVLNRRLQKAKNLLAGSNMTIKAICVECGFENIESFYRAFRKHTDLTPGDYRNKFTPYTNL